MSTMGERIKAAREAHGLLQSQLAKIIDVKSAGVISNWEQDVSKPDANKIVRLCHALDISASYLLDYHGREDQAFTPSEQAVIKKYRTLDEYGKKAVDSALDVQIERMQNTIVRLPAVARSGIDMDITMTAEEYEARKAETLLDLERLDNSIIP